MKKHLCGILSVILCLSFFLSLEIGAFAANSSVKSKSDKSNTLSILDICDSNIDEITAGQTILLGKYEQDNNLSNGSEDIEWLVLDREDNSILLVSKYALDVKAYDETGSNSTWESCSLRKWLNGSFYNDAFSKAEKNMIIKTKVTADKNPNSGANSGKDTEDNVFLLSIPESTLYFSSAKDRQCKPTKYAESIGLYTDDYGNTAWWLRSPGDNNDFAALVDGWSLWSGMESSELEEFINSCTDFDILYCGNFVSFTDAVRPALWISIN